jgi:DEAD/DEAH box helicase domain-containing protein
VTSFPSRHNCLGWLALDQNTKQRDRLTKEVSAWDGPALADVTCSADELIADIDGLATECKRDGLAHSLAEAGRLPMFGMPTRVRDLYLGLRHEYEFENGRNNWVSSVPLSIDRDTELAIYEFAPGSIVTKDKKEHRCVGFSPILRGSIVPTGPWYQALRARQPRPPIDAVVGPAAFGEAFWINWCRCCGTWRREDVEPLGDSALECRTCRAVLTPSEFKRCREPLAYRTDFDPSPAKEMSEPGARFRSIHAEGIDVKLTSVPDTNLSYYHAPSLRTFRMNRGRPLQGGTDSAPNYRGFSTETGVQTIRPPGPPVSIRFQAQEVSLEYSATVSLRDKTDGEAGIWLAAPKTTEGLFIAPSSPCEGLRLSAVSGPTGVTSVRAAALSASFLLVDKASMELDVDPDEFDVIDPVWCRVGSEPVPLLQVVDHLVNGAGFCQRLSEQRGGRMMLASILEEMLDVKRKQRPYPLDQLLEERHRDTCDQACYKCLLRYRNQPYHGLLDWQLGLAFLQTLAMPGFQCGLDDVFEPFAGLAQWPTWAEMYARQMARLYQGEATRVGSLWCFTMAPNYRVPRPVLVVHPLWERDAPTGILREALEDATDRFQAAPLMADTFNLARRRGWVVEKLARTEMT